MSILDVLEPIYRKLPEVRAPEVAPPLKKKLMWSSLTLILFFVMGHIRIIGLSSSSEGVLENLQVILASKIGSLITAGIGPIVLASIILQLLVGGKIINIDLTNPADKARFSGLQKLFAIVLCFFEAAVYAFSGMLQPEAGMLIPVILQVALGSIILLYLDEVVSKYGIGSGIGLFIAGGVSETIFWRMFGPQTPETHGITPGIVWQFLESISTGVDFLLLLPILSTLIVFLVVVYAEGMHVNIPITMGRRGTGGRFPVKLLYVSNIPVILAVALFANIQLWAMIIPDLAIDLPDVTIPFINFTITELGTKSFMLGLSALVKSPFGLIETLARGGFQLGLVLQGIGYLIILVAVCVVFGRFWVEMGGQGPEAVSNQLSSSGMYIPGFRRDPRIIRGILERYIPPITVLGSAFVGLLAGLADFTSALGSGTGILLTVGIVYRLYEELAKQQLMETNPLMKRLFGG
jgi:preprotein translocase subunit SecY